MCEMPGKLLYTNVGSIVCVLKNKQTEAID